MKNEKRQEQKGKKEKQKQKKRKRRKRKGKRAVKWRSNKEYNKNKGWKSKRVEKVVRRLYGDRPTQTTGRNRKLVVYLYRSRLRCPFK